MEATGILIAAMETRSGVSQRSGQKWMSREYVMKIEGDYPKHMAFTVFGEERLRNFALRSGELVTVSFDIDAREYNGRWYNDIRVYRVERPQQPTQQSAPAQQAQPVQAPQPSLFPPNAQPYTGSPTAEKVDDLPF